MKLVIFDVDGTLVDSQELIVGAMGMAYEGEGLEAPSRAEVLKIVGLSLDEAVARITPDLSDARRGRIVQGYRDAFFHRRLSEEAPLYPGARECLDRLNARDDLLLAVATGKSRRGLDAMIALHGLEGMFVTLQTADFHPSKPHPAMLEAALAEAGVSARDAVMIGDTSFDMQMAKSANVTPLGVDWGYHARAELAPLAAEIFDDFPALTRWIEAWAA